MQIQLKADRPGKGRLVKIFAGPLVDPAHGAGERQIQLVDFAQQYMQRSGMQRRRQPMPRHVDQETTQQHPVIAPVEEIQITADIAERRVNCFALDELGRCRQAQQRILHPRRQRRFPQRLPFASYRVRHVAERQQAGQAILMADQRCRQLDIDQRAFSVSGGEALCRQEPADFYSFQQQPDCFVIIRIQVKQIRCMQSPPVNPKQLGKPAIGVQNRSRIRVAQQHRLRRLLDHRLIAFFCFGQRFFGKFTGGDLRLQINNAGVQFLIGGEQFRRPFADFILQLQLCLTQGGLRLLAILDFFCQRCVQALQFFIDGVHFLVHRGQVLVGDRQLASALIDLDFQVVAGLDQGAFNLGKRADDVVGLEPRRGVSGADRKQHEREKKPLQIADRRIGRLGRLRHDHQPTGAGDRRQTD